MRWGLVSIVILLNAGGLVCGEDQAGAWRPARALNKAEGSEIVKVKTCLPAGKQAMTALSGEIELEYAMPALKAEMKRQKAEGGIQNREAGSSEEDSARLILGNAPEVGDPGKPVLPVVPCYVALPAGQTLDKVEVVCGKSVKLTGSHKVRHGQKPVPLVAGAKAEYTPPDPAVYESDEAWPKERLEVVGVQKKRGVSILVVNLHPVEYRPKSGQVSYYETLRLKVSARSTGSWQAKPAAGKPDGDKRMEVKYRPDPVKVISERVDNPETVSTYEAQK